MLGAHSHRKGLGLDLRPGPPDGLEGIPGAVPHSQNHHFRRDLPCFGANRREPSAPGRKTGHPGVEAHLAAQPDDLLPDGLHHPAQVVGADVRLGLAQDGGIGSVGHKGLQHCFAQGIVDAGGELSVRKGSGAALAELDIGPGVEAAALPEALHRSHPTVHIAAALQNQRGIAHPGQCQGREHTGRAKTDHHRAVGKCSSAAYQFRELGFAQAHIGIPGPADHFLLVVTFDSHGIDKLDLAAPAGIHRAFDDVGAFGVLHPGPAQSKLHSGCLPLLERDAD